MKKFSNIAFIVIYGIVHIDLITTVQTPFNFINTGNDNKSSQPLIFFGKLTGWYIISKARSYRYIVSSVVKKETISSVIFVCRHEGRD